tara:strand:- start:1633 stop:2040 length:408 start_codon:yes stop_codon:yes gene_type:complete
MPSSTLAISNRIKRARKARGLTQQVLSERLQVTRGAIGHWEQGAAYPSTAKLSSLAAVLDIPLEWLIKGGPSPLQEQQNSGKASSFIGVAESAGRYNSNIESFDKDTLEVARKFFRLPKKRRKVIRELLDQLLPN